MWGVLKWIAWLIFTILKWPIGILLALVVVSILSWKLKWAVFVKDEDLPNETLKGKHNDWWWFMKWIPRKFNAFLGGRGDPKQLLGTNDKIVNGKLIQDVPAVGTWCLSWPFHFVILTKKEFLFGIGVRRDYYGDDPQMDDGQEYYTLRFVCRHN
jgi:hypothetical protein